MLGEHLQPPLTLQCSLCTRPWTETLFQVDSPRPAGAAMPALPSTLWASPAPGSPVLPPSCATPSSQMRPSQLPLLRPEADLYPEQCGSLAFKWVPRQSVHCFQVGARSQESGF